MQKPEYVILIQVVEDVKSNSFIGLPRHLETLWNEIGDD